MTAPHIVDPARLLSEALAEASPDLMRQLLHQTRNALREGDHRLGVGGEQGLDRRLQQLPQQSRTRLREGYPGQASRVAKV